ncbi:ribonucleoside-diphosphate reductase subunit alpha [bacterium]|nr:ribonucleoside-diphosphate reductase subunit alpha [bacterium]MDC1007362.1 ribonucleoside-diphosphate reductase subunit alpha [bacterium]
MRKNGERQMTNGTMIVKRDGSKEHLNIDKIHVVVEHACEGLAGVSSSQIEMNANLQFYDNMSTIEIQEILIRSANDLISLEAPNYQYAAARLLSYTVNKQVFGEYNAFSFKEMIDKNIERGMYDSTILDSYTEEEIATLGRYIHHKRDENFTYAGMRQVVDKYLVQDRSTGELFETPQFMYMMIAATLFAQYPAETRMHYVRRYYDATSLFKVNIPTPVMAGVRTPVRQFASCVLVDSDDTLDSIFASDMSIGRYTAQRAGIGINAGRIRGVNARIRGGEVAHTGIVPFLKKFEATVRCCTQNGVRGGSATTHFPFWHQEIEDILVLKNNKGTEDNRVRKLDYSIQLNKTMYERLLGGGDITLFSPHDVPGLYEAYFGDPAVFQELYEKYERAYSIKKKTISAMELFSALIKERAETGRIYIMNVDHCNTHSSFLDKVYMSNLCQEITLPTKPLQHIDDEDGEIALCILSAINVGTIKSLEDLDELCELAVRALEEIIDYQHYPIKAAEISTKARRSLGVGYIGLAHYLAKNKVKYSDPEAWKLVHDLTETFQYYLLRASNKLAQERGACEYFNRTKYSEGIMPIDTYKKDVDTIVENKLNHDWDSLRSDIQKHGLRHSTLSAQMPSESSSVVSNATNGIEPPRGYLSVKKSKKGPLKQIVPQYQSLKQHYSLLWDMPSNEGYINVVAVMQKFFDQAISGNWSYNPTHFENNEVPMSVMMNDLLTTYKFGWKTSYYQNTYDYKTDPSEVAFDEPAHNVGWHDNQPETQPTTLAVEDDEECEACAI